jgi:glycosyltransferase involved in cell wall biosynthesis
VEGANMPKVSVVIPVYNAMRYLPETLDSVLAQTFTDFEILIINDGSTDNIIEWAIKITDPRVEIISQVNQGVSIARNTGIHNAQGEYIAFLDADDLWKPTKLEKQVSCLDRSPEVGLVYTWTLLINEIGEPISIKYTSNHEGNIWQHILIGDIVCSGSSAMVRKSCFEKSGEFDPALSSAADFDMWTRIAQYYNFSVIKDFLLLYRRTSSSMSRNSLKMIQDLQLTYEKRFQSAPPELMHLKNIAYAGMYRNLAWESMYAGNYEEANNYCKQAIFHDSTMRNTKNFSQLRFAIFLTRWFGSQLYLNLKAIKHISKSGFITFP